MDWLPQMAVVAGIILLALWLMGARRPKTPDTDAWIILRFVRPLEPLMHSKDLKSAYLNARIDAITGDAMRLLSLSDDCASKSIREVMTPDMRDMINNGLSMDRYLLLNEDVELDTGAFIINPYFGRDRSQVKLYIREADLVVKGAIQ